MKSIAVTVAFFLTALAIGLGAAYSKQVPWLQDTKRHLYYPAIFVFGVGWGVFVASVAKVALWRGAVVGLSAAIVCALLFSAGFKNAIVLTVPGLVVLALVAVAIKVEAKHLQLLALGSALGALMGLIFHP